MSLRVLACAGAACVALAASAASAQTNVALNRPVTLVTGAVNGAALSTLTDDVFLTRGQQWQDGTVWWNGLAPTLEIDLGGTFQIDSAIAQVDDNDAYTLLYRDINTGLFQTLWDIPNFDAAGNGMQTRPNADDNTERFFFPGGAVTTDMIRLVAASGDDSYSASEIQVFTVPAPGALALAATGMLLMGRRRR